MIEIEKPNIATINLSEDGRNGKFIIEPLERGYGITLGNSLRRVLINSLPGVAVSNIKIDGVFHEISTIPGVKEDVPEIVLNVKGIVAKLFTDGPKTCIIDVSGERDITAGDIKMRPVSRGNSRHSLVGGGHAKRPRFPGPLLIRTRWQNPTRRQSDRKTRLNSSHTQKSRMPSSA